MSIDIKTDEFLDYLVELTGKECPVCHNIGWLATVPEPYEEGYGSMSLIFTKTDTDLNPIRLFNAGGIATIVIECQECGFIKLFNATKLKEKFLMDTGKRTQEVKNSSIEEKFDI
jgi:hypothetical protein